MQESVLLRARFLDVPRDAKVAPVAKSLAGWSCGTSFSKGTSYLSSMTDWCWRIHILRVKLRIIL